RVRNEPSIYTLEPLRRYCCAISPKRLCSTIRCHSVCSLRSPVFLSVHESLVAIENCVREPPLGKVFVSGSRPKVPTKITLFTPRMRSVFLFVSILLYKSYV